MVYGCWTEDSRHNRVAYPLVRSAGEPGQEASATAVPRRLAATSGGLREADYLKMGEYIQHTCLESMNKDLLKKHSSPVNQKIVSPFDGSTSTLPATTVPPLPQSD